MLVLKWEKSSEYALRISVRWATGNTPIKSLAWFYVVDDFDVSWTAWTTPQSVEIKLQTVYN
jgi:hypothetical protein